MRVGDLYNRLHERSGTCEFEQDELFNLLSPSDCKLTGSRTPYWQPSPRQFDRWRGKEQPAWGRGPRPLTQEQERDLAAWEKRLSTREGRLELENEYYEREDAEFNEIARLRQAAMRNLLEDENLLLEAEIDWRRQFVSDWKLEELEREQELRAAEYSAADGGDGSEPPPLVEAADASPQADGVKKKGSGGRRPLKTLSPEQRTFAQQARRLRQGGMKWEEVTSLCGGYDRKTLIRWIALLVNEERMGTN